jgi:hypothetical protein
MVGKYFCGDLGGSKDNGLIIKDGNFWRQVKYCLTATAPLVKVLKLIDNDAKSVMKYIYEAMDQAKEEIAKSFDNKLNRY